MKNKTTIRLVIIGDEILSGKRQDRHLAQRRMIEHVNVPQKH